MASNTCLSSLLIQRTNFLRASVTAMGCPGVSAEIFDKNHVKIVMVFLLMNPLRYQAICKDVNLCFVIMLENKSHYFLFMNNSYTVKNMKGKENTDISTRNGPMSS